MGWAVGFLGAAIAAVTLWYAIKSLWYYMKIGSQFTSPKEPDVLTAADLVAAAIKRGPAKEGPELRTWMSEPTSRRFSEPKLRFAEPESHNSLL